MKTIALFLGWLTATALYLGTGSLHAAIAMWALVILAAIDRLEDR